MTPQTTGAGDRPVRCQHEPAPDPAWSVTDPIAAEHVLRLAAEHVPVVRRRWRVLRVRYCATCPGRVRYRRCPAIRWVRRVRGSRHAMGWPA